MTGYGKTSDEALTDLKNKFKLYKEKHHGSCQPFLRDYLKSRRVHFFPAR